MNEDKTAEQHRQLKHFMQLQTSCGLRLAVLVDVTQVYDHRSPALET